MSDPIQAKAIIAAALIQDGQFTPTSELKRKVTDAMRGDVHPAECHQGGASVPPTACQQSRGGDISAGGRILPWVAKRTDWTGCDLLVLHASKEHSRASRGHHGE